MQNVIFKVTSGKVVKLIKDENFLDLKTHVLLLPENLKVPVWNFNNLIKVNEEICIFTYDEKIAEVYKAGLKIYESKGGAYYD